MHPRMNHLVLRVIPVVTTAAVFCGCPSSEAPEILTGFWEITSNDDAGDIIFKAILKLNADGSVVVYTNGYDPVPELGWKQSGSLFRYKTGDSSFEATVTRAGHLEGLVYSDADPKEPVADFLMRFLAAEPSGLPQIQEGHWRVETHDLVDGFKLYGFKLNADGTVDESPLGDPFFPSEDAVGFWSEVRSEFVLEFYDHQGALLLRLVTIVGASDFLVGLYGVQGEFVAHLDPNIV